MYDVKTMLKDADSLTVARYLGMEIVTKGSRHYIRCPGHEKRLGKADNRIGNCVLTPKGYRCFACDAKVGLIDMVMEYEGCNYPRALEIIGESCGGAGSYKLNRDETTKRPRLHSDELQLIGLNPAHDGYISRCIINATDDPSENLNDCILVKDGNSYLVSEKQGDWSLQKLFERDEKAYNVLIMTKAREAMKRYQEAIYSFCSRNAVEADTVFELLNEEGYVDSTALQNLKRIYQERYRKAKKIYENYRDMAASD